MGTGIIMGNEILGRIADCAWAHKIQTLDNLFKESKWELTSELGSSRIELINQYNDYLLYVSVSDRTTGVIHHCLPLL